MEILADKTKWLGVTSLYAKGLAKLSQGMELDKDTPEYREAKRQAKDWYGISQAYLKTGEHMAAERMANSTELRGYFRWMEDQPMTFENFYHAEQFKRSMSEMLPSVLAMTGATVTTGGGALVSGATMLALEGSGEWAEAMRILPQEGIPKKDEKGNVIMEPRYITTPDNIRIENPKYGEPVKETMPFEEAAPIAGQASLIYGGISAPLETFQIGRATRLLKFAPEARRSFLLKILDKAVKKAPMTTRGAAWVSDFGIEAVEGGAIEWLQTVTQMTANKAIEEGYGNNPKEALEALAHKLGPMEMTKFMFSEEGGMSDEAKQAFLLGLSGEAGMGAIGGPGRMAYEGMMKRAEALRKRKKVGEMGIISTEGEGPTTGAPPVPPTPPAPPVTTDGDQALTLVQSPDKTGSALGYDNMLVGQATEGSPFYATGVNMIISKAGGAGDDDINKLINRDTRQELDTRPDRKAFNLLNELENDPEARKKVLDVINESPILKAGIVAIDKDIVKNKLLPKDQGTATTTTPSETVIDEINTDEWMENWENVEELANAELEKKGLAKLQEKAEKKYEEDVEEDDAPVSDDAQDLAAGKAMGLQGTDAQILTQYKKALGESEKAPVKKAKKVTLTKNINKEKAPLQHLKDVQQQAGDDGVRAVLQGRKKGGKQANLTTLNVLQNELFPEADRLPVNTKNRGAVVEKITHKIFSMAPAVVEVAPHKRKAPTKKKAVKTIAKKKPITETEVIPDTGEITVFRDKEKSTIKVEKATDNVSSAIDLARLEGLGGVTSPDKKQQAQIDEYEGADTLIASGDQAGLIKQMQQMNVPGADKIPVSKDGKVDYGKADTFIREFFKDSFKYIRYNNKQLPQKGTEFHDLAEDKFYGTEPDIAKQYDKQRQARDQKKVKPDAEDIAMAKQMGIPVEDYMKTLEVSEKGAPAKKVQVEETRPVSYEKGQKAEDVVYTGAFIPAGNELDILHAGLKQNYGKDATIHADHVTFQFKPDEKHMESLNMRAGDLKGAKIVRIIEDDKAVVAVIDPTSLGAMGQVMEGTPHITLVTFGDTKPFYSNELIKKYEAGEEGIDVEEAPKGKDLTVLPVRIGAFRKGIPPVAPAKKKERKPTAVEANEALIDDIIGAPEVSSKTKSKVKTIAKEAQTKQDAATQKTEEIDSATDDINDKLDEDLCI